MQSIKNIISLVILSAWLVFGGCLAWHWTFADFWDWAAYIGILAFVFFIAMAGVSAAQSYKKAR